ncbi:MAG: uracil-DNA glycosylase family protein [Phycisphaerae bacterium]
MDLVSIARELVDEVSSLRFGPPVAYVYNPLDYARASHERYLRRFGRGRREVVLMGMNPGPWGMAQTGVPFGEVGAVRDWLGIDEPIGGPDREHPKRPVRGLACPRSEVSGARVWGWARRHFETPERFFERFFVINYCPLAFLEDSGRNRTPDKLPADQRQPLLEACDRALRRTVQCLGPRYLIGVGNFAESRARAALPEADLTIGRILHPSPANPAAHRNWAGQINRQLAEMGIELPQRV